MTNIPSNSAPQPTPPRAIPAPAPTMPNSVTIAGKVLWQRSKRPVRGVAVAAIPDDGDPLITRTLNDGSFRFPALPIGTWAFVPLHQQSVTPPPRGSLRDKTDTALELRLPEGGTPDKAWGWRYFGAVIVALVLLTAGYLWLHVHYPARATPASAPFADLLTQAVEEATGLGATGQLTATLRMVSQTNDSVLSNQLRALSDTEKQQIRDLVSQAENYAAQGKIGETQVALRTLQRRYDSLSVGGFFWSAEPWRYGEVLLWGLAGVLITQIIVSANYVREGRFYREGLALHLAQIFTIPIVALVAVFIISLVKLQITIGGNEVQLDLSNPAILVALSFLIGVNFWNVWDALKNSFGSLDLFNLGGADQPGNS